MTSLLKHPRTKAQRFLRKFKNNRDGVAAIEFALIAPVMLAMYLGLAEVSLLVMANRGVSHATSVTADLVTQVQTADEDEIENILDATFAVLELDYAQASRVKIDVASFEMDASDNVNEVGYASIGASFGTHYDPTAVSATLLNQVSGLIVVRMEYEYHSPSREFVGTPTLTETFMLKPRKSATVPFENGGITTIACSLVNSSPRPTTSCN